MFLHISDAGRESSRSRILTGSAAGPECRVTKSTLTLAKLGAESWVAGLANARARLAFGPPQSSSLKPLPGLQHPPAPLVVRVAPEAAAALSFSHEQTAVLEQNLVAVGTTCWVASALGKKLFMAWRWALISDGVVCIESPLNIDSNIYVIGEGPSARRRRLNLMISRLEWQSVVVAAIPASSN